MIPVLAVVAFATAMSPNPTNNLRAPEPVNAESVFRVSDYPRRALANNEGGFAKYEVTIDPNGRVESCTLLIATGVADLDRATCRLMFSRARFKPAIDANGQPTFGVVRAWNSWQVGKWLRASRPRSYDLSLALSRLPADVTTPAYVGVVAAVDDTGKITECRPPSSTQPSTLGNLACEHIMALQDWSPAKTGSGTAVSSVQLIIVQFNAPAADAP